MPSASIFRIGLAALASGALASAVCAQQDVQITPEAVIRACREIHHATNVQAESPTIRGAQDVTFNCRLIGVGATTIAQITPAEVCQRLTGSNEWYRGMGAQIYCRATRTAAPPEPTIKTVERPRSPPEPTIKTIERPPPPEPTIKTIERPPPPEPTIKTIERPPPPEPTIKTIERPPPPEPTIKTIERPPPPEPTIKTIERPPPPEPTIKTIERPPPPGPRTTERPPAVPPVRLGAGPFNDVPLTHDVITKACRALHGNDATMGPTTYARKPYVNREPTLSCQTAGGFKTYTAAQFCPPLSGTSGSYLTDFGRGAWMQGAPSFAAVHVCRGPGPLQYHALADVDTYCRNKGHRYGNLGTAHEQSPACFDPVKGSRPTPIPVSVAALCRDMFGTNGAHERRGTVYHCLPAGTPLVTAPVIATPTPNPCPHCASLVEAIAHYEQQINETEKRIADEEIYKRGFEEGLKTRTGREREDWQGIARDAAARIEERKKLLTDMKAALEDRKAQLKGRPCTEPVCREVVSRLRPDLVPPESTIKTVERPEQAPTPPTIERPPEPKTAEQPPTVPPEPEPKQASAKPASDCPDHEAELTNGKTVFHRLYVLGNAQGFFPFKQIEGWSWERQMRQIKSTLEDPHRQAPKSTTRTIEQPTIVEFTEAVMALQEKAQACEEVTIVIKSHADRMDTEPGSEDTRGTADLSEGGSSFTSRQLGELIRHFKPDVSITVVMDSCLGGAFGGKGDVEESKLVQLIGLSTVCFSINVPLRTEFSEAIGIAIDTAANANPGDRATAAEVKKHLAARNWPLGEPPPKKADK